ncbi:MAG: hypothetical protein ACKO3P_09500, partial [Planctomycetaceae bacterium]
MPAKEILNFQILDSSSSADRDKDSPIRTFSELLDQIPLIPRSNRKCRFPTLGDLLRCTDPDWNDHKKHGNSSALGWNHYPAFGLYEVTPRRLADCWIEFNQLVARVKPEAPKEAQEALHAGIANAVQETIESHYRRAIDIDSKLSAVAQIELRTRPPVACQRPTNPPSLYSRDLSITGDTLKVDASDNGSSSTRTREYTARLRFTDLTSVSPVPEFVMGAPHAKGLVANTQQATSSTRIETIRTRVAIVLLHDLRELLNDDQLELGDAPVLTSVEPVRVAWVGPEGEVDSYPWPVPPLRTYASTSLFLNRWDQHLKQYLSESEPSSQASLAIPPEGFRSAELVKFLIAQRRHASTPRIESTIAPEQVADLILLWLHVAFEALEEDLNCATTTSAPKTNPSPADGTDGTKSSDKSTSDNPPHAPAPNSPPPSGPA